jgi:S-DNA-T family DNA segregation ATPase FtsK/SpoIIIE
MPRAALTDHAPARPSSSSGRFASAAVRAVLRRRAMEMCGLLVALGAIGLGVALGSHNPADPSLNTSTHGVTTNLAGPAGAIVSDLMLQVFGFASALPCLAMLAWAFRLATHRGPRFGRGAGAGAAGRHADGGGSAVAVAPCPGRCRSRPDPAASSGPALAGLVVDGLASLLGPLGTLAGQSIIMVGAVGTAFIACGLTVGEWRGGRPGSRSARGRFAVVAARSGAASLRRGGPGRPDDEDEDVQEAEAPPPRPRGPGLIARLGIPFRTMGRGAGALLRREPMAVPLGAMLRAADEAATAVPAQPGRPAGAAARPGR